MGVVYRGRDPVLHRELAIKVMSDSLARDDDFRSRFMQEARAAGSIQHPNVVTVYDCGEVDGHLYIAMEYVKGADLEQLQSGAVPLTTANKLEIVIGVLNGLGFAHKRGIVHRDVKPANIRVNEEGRPLIMDFGIAHLSSSNMTKTGMMMGTPNYMAPEQVVGGPISAQTDIFAIGVVLYELLTGTRPFEGANLHSVLYKIVSEEAPAPERVVSGIRPDLAVIVKKALSKDPADRFVDAAEMAAALSRVLSGMSDAANSAKTMSLRSSIELSLAEGRAAATVVANAAPAAPVPAITTGGRKTQVMAVAAVITVVAMGGIVLATRKAPPASSSGVPAPNTASLPAATPGGVAPAAQVTPAPVSTAPAPAVAAAPPPKLVMKTETGTGQDVELVRSLQALALQTRRRAVDAGSTAEQLAPGDQLSRQADKAIGGGKRADAAGFLNKASSAWSDAERAARAAAAAATVAAANVPPPVAVREDPKPKLVTAAPVVQAPPPVVATVNPSVEVAAAVAQYAKALSSRDITELRRIYPNMTAEQRSAFQDFFSNVRSLQATLTMSNLQVDGNSAEARMAGTYDFVTGSGKAEHQPISLQAVLKRDANGWIFASVR